MLNNIPKARNQDLIVQPLQDETMIYDTTRDQALLLNPTASQIWKACDGNTTVNDLTALVPGDLDSSVKQEIVLLGLSQLDKHKLLAEPLRTAPTESHITRRHLLKLGVAAALLPVVASLVAPTAAQAQSGSTGPTGPTGGTL